MKYIAMRVLWWKVLRWKGLVTERQWTALPVMGLEITEKPFRGKAEIWGFGWSESVWSNVGPLVVGMHESQLVREMGLNRRDGMMVVVVVVFLHLLASFCLNDDKLISGGIIV